MNIKSNRSYGGSWHGDTIYTSKNKLIALFGEPREGDPDKVKYEWGLILNDKIPFTIYDYREPPFEDDELISFHIGADSLKESNIVKKELVSLI